MLNRARFAALLIVLLLASHTQQVWFRRTRLST